MHRAFFIFKEIQAIPIVEEWIQLYIYLKVLVETTSYQTKYAKAFLNDHKVIKSFLIAQK